MTYTIITVFHPKRRVYDVLVPALPGCHAEGSTKAEAQKRAKEEIRAYMKALKKLGEPKPQDVVTMKVWVARPRRPSNLR
jgi:predicted RNase H-like HicB family nuclease